MLALSLPTDTDVLTRYGAIGTVALVVVGVLVAKAVQSILRRLVSLTVIAVLVVVIWGQRSALADCAHRVKEAATAPSTITVANPTCTVFGAEVTVPVDKLHPASTK